MNLLDKFDAVTIQADNRISETDKNYCETHQEAYEAALTSFKELGFFWEDMLKVQNDLLGPRDSNFFYDYLSSSEGPNLSNHSIHAHIKELHREFIQNIVYHFNSTYHVTVSNSDIRNALLPEEPDSYRRSQEGEKWETYNRAMQTLTVKYADVVEQIILRLDGRSFVEQAFHELKVSCHNAAWNTYKREAKFERRKDTIRFTDYGCSYEFVYKGYSAATRKLVKDGMYPTIKVYDAVLNHQPEEFKGYERLLRKKKQAYEQQCQNFCDMTEDDAISNWLQQFSLWDAENEETIRLNDMQRMDINRMLQKQYGLLQWEQGSGKTLAGIATGRYRMEKQNVHSTWVISSAISIRNNWDVVLKNYGLSYVFVERLKDLERIQPGDFVLITLNKVGQYQKQIAKWARMHNQKIQLVLDESDEISNPYTVRAKAVLVCFRRCRYKLLTTGTSTRNNISDFAPQLELLYNNSINMLNWCDMLYHYDKEDGTINESENEYYGQPIPAYKKGYSIFSACHLPEKATVFGIGERTQDIYNADALNDILAKTVITRTFEEITGKEIRRLHQVPLHFAENEREVYIKVIKEFQQIQRQYFASTGNSRKDSMLRLMQQITLLLRVSSAPNTLQEYEGDTPVKVMAAVEMAAQWENEIVAIGVRHKVVLDAYDTLENFLLGLDRCVEENRHIGNAQIEFVRQFDRQRADRYRKYWESRLIAEIHQEFEERAKREAEEQEKTERRKAEDFADRAKLLGWADEMTPMKFGRVKAVLDTLTRVDGKIMSRRDFVIRMVQDGWLPSQKDGVVSYYGSRWEPKESKPKTEYRLCKDGFLYKISKTEYDFALYLTEHGTEN